MRKRSFCMVMFGFLFACSGCVVMVENKTTLRGTAVPASTFGEVVNGQTTREWLVERLGQPTSVDKTGEGREDLIYECTERTQESAAVFILLGAKKTRDRIEQAVFEVKDGIVQQHYLRSPMKDPGAQD